MDTTWTEALSRWTACRLELAGAIDVVDPGVPPASTGSLASVVRFFGLDEQAGACLSLALGVELRPDAAVVLGALQAGISDGILPATWCTALRPYPCTEIAARIEHLAALGLLEARPLGALGLASWLRRGFVPVPSDREVWRPRMIGAHHVSWGLREDARRDLEATLRGWLATEPGWGRPGPRLMVRGPLLASALEAAEAVLSLATGRYLLADEDEAAQRTGATRSAVAAAAVEGRALVLRLDARTAALERQRLVDALCEAPVPVVFVATEEMPELGPVEAVCQIVTSVAGLRDPSPTVAWERALPPELDLQPGFDLETLGRRQPLPADICPRVVELARWQSAGAAVSVDDLARAGAIRLADTTARLTDERPASARVNDLVLAPDSAADFHELLGACRLRGAALDAFPGAFDVRTRGIVTLFHGPPGTGKTFAAEVIAAELGVPLRVIVVSDLLSKWVGETDKRIRDLFEVARGSRSVLLFDEADGLFGRRVAVEKASDRYANVSSGVLLQELERYDGVVVLTTNLPGAIDPAFQRRIRYSVEFPEPERDQREALWRCNLDRLDRVAPDVDPAELADAFPLTGARIRNTIVRAAYAAAGRPGEPVLDRAVLDEYARRECADAGVLLRVARREVGGER